MKKLNFAISALTALAATAAISFSAAHGLAGELDNERAVTNRTAQPAELPGTLVVRKKANNNSVVEVLHTALPLAANDASAKSIQALAGKFKSMPVKSGMQNGKVISELDRDSSTSSWYFCYPTYNWSTPAYYYGGSTYYYQSYYNYSWGGYNYYYYGYPRYNSYSRNNHGWR
jgi:hypothetical protein